MSVGGPDRRNHGILQAELSWEDCERVSIARRHSGLETSFRTESPSANDHAPLIIVYVRPEDASDKWLTGYGLYADFTEVYKASNL